MTHAASKDLGGIAPAATIGHATRVDSRAEMSDPELARTRDGNVDSDWGLSLQGADLDVESRAVSLDGTVGGIRGPAQVENQTPHRSADSLASLSILDGLTAQRTGELAGCGAGARYYSE